MALGRGKSPKHNRRVSTVRPISLTCVSCKIMEHIITSNVMRHASTHNILYHLQHGFRDKRSCETQLLQFQNDIVANMNNGKQTDVIVMDFAKAFDKVGHRRLIEKMKYYGGSKRVQPTRGWTVAASTQHKLYSLLLPPAMGARFYRFLGRPAKWTRWLAGAAAIKSG